MTRAAPPVVVVPPPPAFDWSGLYVGVGVAGIALVIGSSLGGENFKLRDVLLLAVALTVFCTLVFITGLKLPIPVCPGFEFFEQFRLCRV